MPSLRILPRLTRRRNFTKRPRRSYSWRREAPENPFSQKRMTIMLNATGFTFVGKDYVKTVAHGKEVSRTKLATEKAYREALEAAAGIKLAP